MMVAQRLCDNFKTCSNAGRYIAVDGRTLCSLCSMDTVAVRFVDIPRFIVLAMQLARDNDSPEAVELRQYLPRRT